MGDQLERSDRENATAGDPAVDVTELVPLADRLAAGWHAGQTDKNGDPYIDHPRRVAAGFSTPTEKMVALLHDVLEDTRVTPDDLTAAGFPTEVVEAVALLTHRKGQSEDDYLTGVACSALATVVKRADIADNADPTRLARLADAAVRDRLTAKYRHALAVLDECSTQIRD